MIPFTPWLPDVAVFDTAASGDVVNVLPSETGFRPMPDLGVITSALTARCQGAFSTRSLSGAVNNFAGDATKLYKMSAGGMSWNDVTRSSGGAYATATDEWWDFTQFGDHIIACNQTDDTQYYEMGVSTNFAALSGAPKASYAAVVRDFAVLGRLSTGYNSLHWSAINDPTDWTPSTTTLSDVQVFPEGGQVMGIVGGEYGVVFLERAIQRMSFEGPPSIFRFDKISTAIGCRVSRSIAAYGQMIFFLSDDGFQMVTGGSQVDPIGEGKIDRFFEQDVNISALHLISATIDPINKLYIMGYASGDSETANRMLFYHWPTGQWTRAKVDHEFLYPSLTQVSYTIDTMDTVSATIDGLTYPVDSRFWGGQAKLLLSGFDEEHKQGYFSGLSLEAIIETNDVQITPGRRTMTRGFRPMVEARFVTPTISVGYRNSLDGSVTWTPEVAVNSQGYCPVRTNARYHRVRMTIPAGDDWTLARGIDDIKSSPMGAR